MRGMSASPIREPMGPRPARGPKPPEKDEDFKAALARARPAAPAQAARPQAPAAQQVALGANRAPLPRAPALPPADLPGARVSPFAAGPDNQAFRQRIAEAERSHEHGGGYHLRNERSGALGRYQMLGIALQDIGWRDARGGWTGRAAAFGVRSETDFLGNPAAQEAAMGDFLRRVETQLQANGALRSAGGVVAGVDGRPVAITESGLVAAAHRRGAGAVQRWLLHRTETPDAPVPERDRAAFASIEARLRGFAGVAYAMAGSGTARG
jgi:hypothetical protein